MTSPDGFMPPNAINAAGSGLANFAATTEEDYREQLTGQFNPALSLLQNGFQNAVDRLEQIPLFGPLIEAAVAAVQEIIDTIANALGHTGGEPYSAADILSFLTDDVHDAIANVVSNINALISGVSGTVIADVVTALQNGVTALTRITSLISGVSGASTISDVVAAINAATTKLSALISGVSGTVIADVVAAINNSTSNLQTLLNNLWDIFNGSSGSSGKTLANVLSIGGTFATSVSNVVANLQTLLNNLFDAFNGSSGSSSKTLANVLTAGQALYTALGGKALQADLQTLLNNLYDIFNSSSGSTSKTLANVLSIGGTFATSVATVISNLQTLLNNLFDAFGGTSGSSGKTLANVLTIAQTFYTAVSTATSNIAALISGVSGTVIADVVAAIGKIQQAIDALVNLFKGDVASGHTIADLVTHATAALKGLLPAVFFNGDGTAAALEGITFHGDGTASYVTDLVNSSAHALVDGLDGTVTTVANALHNMAFGANSFSKGLTQSVHDAGQAIDSLVNRLLGTSGSGKSAAVADVAVAGAAANIAATSATVNTVQTQLGALGLGFAISTLAATVDFGQYANTSTTPSGFTGFQNDPLGAGQIGVSSGRAAFIAGSTGPVFLRYNVSATATDNQLISVVPTSGASVEIFGRINAAGDTFIYGHAGNGGAAINISVSGTTSNAVAASHTFQPGATYTLVCGTVTGTKYCDLLCNGVSIVGGALNITASSAGASFRYGGFGITDAAAATVSTFSLSDNTDLLTGPGLPANAQVATSQTSASATYGDLATVGPAVTVTIGSSGMALVCHSVWLNNNTASASSWQSWAATGANTIAADDAYGVFAQAPSTGTAGQQWQIGRSDVVTGLSAGSTTFTAKYRRSAGTGTFLDRAISVIPL